MRLHILYSWILLNIFMYIRIILEDRSDMFSVIEENTCTQAFVLKQNAIKKVRKPEKKQITFLSLNLK